MTLLLAGDIGGTKTILRLVTVGKSSKDFQTIAEEKYPSGDFPDLVPMVQKFLNSTEEKTPEQACFAIAGPVINNTSDLTNLSWSLDNHRLGQELGMEKVSLINDFAAVGYGILGLEEDELYVLRAGKPQKGAPIGVLGAGTGLGQAFLIPQPDSNYQVFPTEGGHVEFAPRSPLEFQLLEYLAQKYNIDHVSVERVVSGQGIVAIYQFLRDSNFAPESAKVGEAIRAWEENAPEAQDIDPAATISQASQSGSDRLAAKAMEMFISAYGAEAGNLALKLLPHSGIYIAGGIAAKIIPNLESGEFLDSFQQKGRVSPAIAQVPIYVVLNPEVGLLGSVMYGLRA